jgi:tetratricopeptide (TPR) repeat protein
MQRLLLLVAAALFLGCQQAPALPTGRAATPPAPASPHVSAALALKAEGDALMGRADYRGAADRYRRAVALDPDDMTIRFALGTAHTFLAERRQAVEQFRTVVSRGDPKSVEQREARRWLAAAGIPAETDVARAAASSSRAKAAGESASAPEKLVGGRLVGRMEWPGVDPKTRAIRGELWIHGAEAANEKVTQSRPISLGGRYHFYNIPPGQYRITARLFNVPKDVTLWDQKVTVEDGRPTELILTPATALIPPDKFPPPPQGG